MSECRACARAGEEICDETFICPTCWQERRVCSHLPGGLDAFTDEVREQGAECVMCQEKGTMDEAWIDKWHKKKGG